MGYDFETDKKYNYEHNISMSIELDKTCFSREENITGFIILKLKNGLQTTLSEPIATFKIDEYHHYYYHLEMEDKEAQEHYSLLSTKMRFPNFQDANLMKKVKIPFKIQVPKKAYPTCIFSKSAYVRHYLSIEFASIKAKKTVVFVVKNNFFFTSENNLLLSPAIYFREIKKRSLLSEKGSFTASLKIPINSFTYDQTIPFEVNIDCTNLKTKIKRVLVYLERIERQNQINNHLKASTAHEKIISYKTVHLIKGLTKYHIKDDIKLYSNNLYDNPKEVYESLDIDKRKEKYEDVGLFPSCYGGLLSCEYYIVMLIETINFFSYPEELKIPIDFFEPYASTSTPKDKNRTKFYYDINEYDAPERSEVETPK